MTTPRQHAEFAARYFTDDTMKCWARFKKGNRDWALMEAPSFDSSSLEYHVGHEPPPPAKRTITEQPDLKAAEQLLLAHGYTVTKPLTFEDVEPMTEAPLKGARYWVVSAAERDGACSVQFANDAFDRRIIQRRMAYLDREDALIAARHIFGLKGGEL